MTKLFKLYPNWLKMGLISTSWKFTIRDKVRWIRGRWNHSSCHSILNNVSFKRNLPSPPATWNLTWNCVGQLACLGNVCCCWIRAQRFKLLPSQIQKDFKSFLVFGYRNALKTILVSLMNTCLSYQSRYKYELPCVRQ